MLEYPSIYTNDQAYQVLAPTTVGKLIKLINKKLPLKPLKSPLRGKMNVRGYEALETSRSLRAHIIRTKMCSFRVPGAWQVQNALQMPVPTTDDSLE